MSKARSRKLQYVIILGLSTCLVSIILSSYLMYYSSPKEELFGYFLLNEYDSSKSIEITLPKGASEKIFYLIRYESTAPLKLKLLVYDKKGLLIKRIIINGSSGISEYRNSIILIKPPSKVRLLIINEHSSRAKGELSIRFSLINYMVLSILSLISTALSLIGISLLAYGIYAYLIAREIHGGK